MSSEDLTYKVAESVLESVWDHFKNYGLKAFPENVQQELAQLGARSGSSEAAGAPAGLEDLADRVEAVEDRLRGVASVAREAKEQLSERLEQVESRPLGSGGFRRAAIAELQERLEQVEGRGSAGGGSSAALEARVAAIEERLAALEAAPARPSGAAAPAGEVDVDALANRLISSSLQPVMKAIDGRLDKVSDTLAVEAASKALEAVEGRLDEIRAAGGVAAAADDDAESGDAGYSHKRFTALAREVMSIKQAVERPSAERDLLGLLNSSEFKELFDQKVNQVLGYLKSDVIPRAVKDAVQGS